jgi:PIF1-like helicase
MNSNSKDALCLKKSSLIIIDEISMLPNHGLWCVNLLLKRISNNDKSFGGKVVVVGEDFRQTLPVIPKGNRATIIESTVKSNILWSEFKTLSLSVNMRTKRYRPHNE